MNSFNINEVMTIPEESLDEKDRQILIELKDAGAKGLGFNALVEKLQPRVSRSTVAVRIEKLLRLGYLNKKQDNRTGRARPIYLSPRTKSVFIFIDKSREMSQYLLRRLDDLKISNLDLKALENWFNEFRDRYNAIFGMTAVVAVLYGVSSAGDLFLPLLIDDYKALFNKLADIMRDKPNALKALRSLIDWRLADNGTSLEELKMKMKKELERR
jgi:DNA-binding Lrp family transcriptional regulator